VRYADDFVVVTQTKDQAEEAFVLVNSILQTLGLELSPEKTKITTFGKGYDFLGFTNSSWSCRMRGKSVKKFKDKIREMTFRRHNLDAKCIMKLNRVIRGTANYFGARFSTNRWLFQKLDSWIRTRLRCMKFKSKSRHYNYKLRVRWFKETLGLIAMVDILLCKGM
jgi:RNA-directed DNA polymerase